MRRLLVLVAFGLLVSGCSLLRAFGPPEPTLTATAPPDEGVVKVSGDGDGRSDPFALAAGNYEVVYGASPDSPASCVNQLTLVSQDPPFSAAISDGHRNGATFVGDVPAGAAYSIDAISTCHWEVTIKALS
jgi:hypothetical protein